MQRSVNNLRDTNGCPECESHLVDDIHNGEVICSGCGIIVNNNIAIYTGPENHSSTTENKVKTVRATGHLTYAQHDLGVATDIPISRKDFGGKNISGDMAIQMNKLRKWHQRVRTASSRDRRLANVFDKDE